MMDRTKYYQKQSAAEQEAYVELCRHLEHAQDEQLLSDHTAVLLYALNSDRRAEGLELLRSQLQSRRMTPGRVNSWYVDCGARLREDREGFCQRAQEEYLRLELEAERRRRARPKDPVARIRPASAFAPERTRYLVQPYLPRGMLSILGGVSGVGKTSLALDIAAALTAGRALGFEDPEDAEDRKGCTVIYLTAENDPNKVLRPRAEAMGADLDRLFFQSGANLCMNEQDLFDICRAYRPDLLVFDPIQSYLGQGVQMNRAEQVRPLMDQLNGLAKELDMAVLLISHMSKPGPGICSALDRLLGSSDFRNAARSILIVGRDPQLPEGRVFAHAKNSLGPEGVSQSYHIAPAGNVCYDGESELTADRIIQSFQPDARGTGRPGTSLSTAMQALDHALSFVGWVDYAEVERLCAAGGYSQRTMRRAKEALELQIMQVGLVPNRKTIWYRKDLKPEAVRADYLNENQQVELTADLDGQKSV